jgi:hypothetical protein
VLIPLLLIPLLLIPLPLIPLPLIPLLLIQCRSFRAAHSVPHNSLPRK